MNTTEIIELARANYRITTKNPYVNSWFEAPKGFWEVVLEYATRLAKKDGSIRAPNKTTVAKMVILYGHIVALYVARQGKKPIPMSCDWLDNHLIRIPIEKLTAEGTGIRLVHRYKRPWDGVKGLCSKIEPLPEIMDLLIADGEIMSVREFLKFRKFDTRGIKFSGIKSIAMRDLIVVEGWLSGVPDEFPTPVVSVAPLGKGAFPVSSALWEVDSSVVNAPTTIRSQTYREGLIRIDLEAALRQLETYPLDKRALYSPPLNFIRKHTDKDGHYCCRYKPFSFFGRYFEFGGGIQALKRDIRQALLQPELDAGHLFNYDIKKCQAFGMEQLFKHLQQDTACLDHVLDSTKFGELCSELGVPEDLLKTAIYAGVWNGSLEVYRYGRESKGFSAVAAEFVEKLGKESGLTALAKVRDRLAPLTRQIKTATEVLNMPLGAFLTQLEQAYIHAIVVLCERAGIRVVSLQHDGIMTNRQIPDHLMKQAAELSGFIRARLVEKAFCDMRDFQSEEEQEFFEGMTG